MTKSKATFYKRQREVQRQQKKQLKEEKKLQRAAGKHDGGHEDSQYAYVDENGNLTDVKPGSAGA